MRSYTDLIRPAFMVLFMLPTMVFFAGILLFTLLDIILMLIIHNINETTLVAKTARMES